jgi:GNAT superfamily N-acetyltransferase
MQVIRTLLPFETVALREHFMRLTEEERYLRFAGPAPEAAVERYLRGIDWTRAIRLGAFADGTLRGVAELVLTGNGAAELAVTVEGAFQHHGIGSELIRRVLVIARNRGIRTVVAHCLTENRSMRHLVRKFTGRTAFDGANAEASFPTGVATPLSYWHEGVQAMDGLIGSVAQQLLGRPLFGLPRS